MVVWTNGCFDCYHEGHRHAIHQCRGRGDLLVVGVNSTSSTRELKGPDRPKDSEDTRARNVLDAGADYVLIFDERWPADVINTIDPDIVAKGESYRGRKVAGSSGRQLFLHDEKQGVSTTSRLQQETTRPSALHIFWSGSEFSLARYVAVMSALTVHEPETFILWTLQEPIQNPYYRRLRSDPRIEVRSAASLLPQGWIDRCQKIYGKLYDRLAKYQPRSQIVFVKDLTMWKCLEKGGIFLDIDTLSYRPFYHEFDDATFYASGLPATGVLGARPGSPIVEKILEKAEEWLNDPDITNKFDNRWNYWTLFGPTLLSAYLSEYGEEGIQHAPGEQHYYNHEDIDRTFREDGAEIGDAKEDIRTLHYYGEGRNEMSSEIDPNELVTEKWLQESSSLYATLTREVLGDHLFPTDHSSGPGPEQTEDLQEVEPPPSDSAPDETSAVFFTLTALFGDEEDNIVPALESIKDITDQYILVSNGGEETRRVAREFFEENDIPEIPADDPQDPGYRIYRREWKGYTQSRQEALELALEHAGEDGYIFKLDMDERLVHGKWMRATAAQHDPDAIFLYCYQGGKDSTRFAFPRAWHVRTNPRYERSDHELPAFDMEKPPFRMGAELDDPEMECYILHHQARRDADGFLDTMMLLRRDIEKARTKGNRDFRSEFYIARDAAAVDPGQSLYWFQQRTTDCDGDWIEERFFAYLYWGDLLKALGCPEEAIEKWETAGNLYPEAKKAREPRCRIANTCYELADAGEGDEYWRKAAQYYEKVISLDSLPEGILFWEMGKYRKEQTDKMRWHLAICKWQLDKSPQTARECLDLLEKCDLGGDIRFEGTLNFFRQTVGRS